jgi:hypothetical protein
MLMNLSSWNFIFPSISTISGFTLRFSIALIQANFVAFKILNSSISSMLALPDFRPPRETEEAMSKRNRNASPPIRLALGNKEGEGESHGTEGSWMRKSKEQLLHQLDLRPGYHHIMGRFSAEKRAGFLENLDKRQMAQILMRLDGYA